MSNFKNWTAQSVEAFEQKQLAKRMDAIIVKHEHHRTDYNPARSHNSHIIDEMREGITERELDNTEHSMMKAGEKENKEVFAALQGRKKKKQNPEYQIQADYVRQMADKYPLVMVFSDTAAHIGKTMFQQIRANKLQSEIAKDWPDVFVAQPSGDYAGLFLEFKAKTPYLKDGVTLSSDKHIRAQAATMDRLRERGYFCRFVWMVEMALETTDKYLNQ